MEKLSEIVYYLQRTNPETLRETKMHGCQKDRRKSTWIFSENPHRRTMLAYTFNNDGDDVRKT